MKAKTKTIRTIDVTKAEVKALKSFFDAINDFDLEDGWEDLLEAIIDEEEDDIFNEIHINYID